MPKRSLTPKRLSIQSKPSAGTKAVMSLIDYLPQQCDYKLYLDNWYSSVYLAYELLDMGFYSTATIQQRRLKNIFFEHDEKEFKKLPRGSSDVICSKDRSLCLVLWPDNKPIHLLSTFLNSEPLNTVRRSFSSCSKNMFFSLL